MKTLFAQLDFDAFHREERPRRPAAGNAALSAPHAGALARSAVSGKRAPAGPAADFRTRTGPVAW